ncbi:hypothetical protein F4782DRAFT_177186 [Xylaria castorea]|nr:hypothetical protein F4782DRAFT_177186 [Xylaria castorea]
MATLPQLENLYSVITDILSNPSLSSCSRALSLVEEVVELVRSSPDANSMADISLLRSCEVYRVELEGMISRLAMEASAHEHMIYERRASSNKHSEVNMNMNVNRAQQKKKKENKHRGVLFNIDKGDHVVAALEALRLEEFLEEQERQNEKKVRFS